MKPVLTLLSSLLLCYLAAAAYLFFKQRDFIYFPSRAVDHVHPVRSFSLDGERIDVRLQTVIHALTGLLDRVRR